MSDAEGGNTCNQALGQRLPQSLNYVGRAGLANCITVKREAIDHKPCNVGLRDAQSNLSCLYVRITSTPLQHLVALPDDSENDIGSLDSRPATAK